MKRTRPASRAEQNWLLSLLPVFPLVLLALRLWYLSRQDLPTMLLLAQYVSPFGMVSALVITLIWTVPAVVLPLRALGGLLLVSAKDPAGRSLLAVTALRMPDWVVALAALLAALTWQLRFLPALLLLLLSIIGLTAWQRHRDDALVLLALTVVVPAVAAVLTYAWLAPGITAAVRAHEWSTVALLVLPPLLALLLTGPVPARFARLATHWPAVGAVLLAPFAIGVVFLRAPILPNAAVEVAAGGGPVAVLNGHIVTVDDTTTTLLDRAGRVRFLPNDDVRSKTLCPEAAQPPATVVLVRGWHVEQSALEWIAPARRPDTADPRCLGRPATS